MQPSGTESARARAEEAGWDVTDCLVLSEGHTDKDDQVMVALFPDRLEAHKPPSITQVSGAVEGGQSIPISGVESATATKDGDLTKLAVQAAGSTFSFWLPDNDAETMRAEVTRLIGSPGGGQASPGQSDPPPPTAGFPTF